MNVFNKVVTVTPRFVFNNMTNYTISIFQTEYTKEKFVFMEKEKNFFHFRKASKEKNLQILIESGPISQIKWRPSGSLEVSTPGDLQFICQSLDAKNIRFFNLSIASKEQYLYMTLEEQEPHQCLLQVENLNEIFPIGITQDKVKDLTFEIPPGSKRPFAWVNPSSSNEVMFWLVMGDEVSNPIFSKFETIDKISKSKVVFKSGNFEEFYVYYNVVVENGARILKISTSEERAIEKLDIVGEWAVDLQLYSLGISIITTKAKNKCELMYFNFSPVRIMAISREHNLTFQLEIKDMIVDNNLVGEPIYPIVICRKRSNSKNKAPAFNFVVSLKNRNRHGVLHIENIQLYFDEMILSLDGLTLNAISEFIRSAGKVYEESNIHDVDYSEYFFMDEEGKKKAKNSLKSWFSLNIPSNKTNYVYLERIQLHALIMILNYNNSMIGSDSYASSFLKSAIGKAIANFELAEIKLRGFEGNHIYGPRSLIINSFEQRYTELIKGAVLEIFFSSGIIGNPNKFFNKFGSGVTDLVEKPINGFLEGPIEGVVGTVHGTASFAMKTVGATFGSLHSITGSIANGLANLSLVLF
jgi:vacuolar protein sorting-associated protein 13A/C